MNKKILVTITALVIITALTAIGCVNIYLETEEECKDNLYRITKVKEDHNHITYVGYTKLTGTKIHCHVRK